MSGVSFGDLVESKLLRVSDGYRAKNDELGGSGPVFLRSAYLQEGGFTLQEPDRFLGAELSRFGDKVAQEGDTVITTKGNSTGRVGYVRGNVEGAVYSPHLSYWRSLNHARIWPRYLYYWSRSDVFLGQLHGLAYATDMAPYFSLRDQMFLRIELPPITEQREIAAVLSALDDKIEVNRKAASVLEEMARALYRSWFVSFDPVQAKSERRPPMLTPSTPLPENIAALFPDSFGDDGLPEGWRLGKLGEVARNARQGADPNAIDPATPYIGLEHVPRRSIAISHWGVADDVGSTKSLMRKGQFLFGKLRPYFHKVGLVPVDGICSTDILVVEAKADAWREFVLTVISSVELVDHVNAATTGTRMPRAKWQDLADYEITVPPLPVVKAFSGIVRPMHDRILSMIEENKTLAALRDSLLPRLMSGELRVAEARERVEEVA